MIMRLLIVNDEIIAADAMQKDIPWERYGIEEAIAVYSAREAKKIIMEKTIDILLCDIEMPGESGIELIRWIRQNELEIECIIITCHAKFEYAKEAVELGCKDYILIPATDEEIGKKVEKVVNMLKKKKEELLLKEYGQQWLNEKIFKSEDTKKCWIKQNFTGKELVKEVISYIVSNISADDLTVSKIANHFYLHPVYLNRIFKKEMHLSISQYIVNERMKLAAQLLKRGDVPATVVAERVGYANYPHFSVMFKKYYGCSPTQYTKCRKTANYQKSR